MNHLRQAAGEAFEFYMLLLLLLFLLILVIQILTNLSNKTTSALKYIYKLFSGHFPFRVISYISTSIVCTIQELPDISVFTNPEICEIFDVTVRLYLHGIKNSFVSIKINCWYESKLGILCKQLSLSILTISRLTRNARIASRPVFEKIVF